MTKKDLFKLVGILMAGAAIFGGMLAWAEKVNHSTPETRAISVTIRDVATLNK